MTFEELSALSSHNIRKAEFDVPKADLECLRQLPDFDDLNPHTETFIMLKPIHGLKDAPRAWRKTNASNIDSMVVASPTLLRTRIVLRASQG